MNKPLMDLDLPSMQAEVNSYKPGLGFAWPQLFPLKYTSKFDVKGIEGDDGIPVTADRVAFNAKSKDKTRKKTGSWLLTLGKIMVSRSKNELEINEYEDAKAIAAKNTEDKAAAMELVNIVYDDMKFCADAMDARVEADNMRIGSLGKFVSSQKFDGDMVEQEIINFNVPEENFIGATVAWSDKDNADGLEDIKRGYNVIKKQGGKAPRYVIMLQEKFDELCAQKKTIKKVATALVKAAGLDSAGDITLDTVNGYLSRHRLPMILVIDPYVVIEDGDGNQHTERPWNANSVVFSPEARLGYTWYKNVPMVKDTEAMQVYGAYYKQTRYSELNPMEETTMGEAYVQGGLSNRKWLVYMNCENTEWNEGE